MPASSGRGGGAAQTPSGWRWSGSARTASTGSATRRARLIAGAEVVFGGRRHLALAAPLIRGEARAWPSPFDAGMAAVLALRGRAVCVLASGDPFQHGVGATLARHVDAGGDGRWCRRPRRSASRRRGSAGRCRTVETLSLHGRPVELIRPLLHPGTRILALTSDGEAPARIAALLAGDGFGPSRLHRARGARRAGRAAVGGDRGRVRRAAGCAALNVLAIEVAAGPGARVLPLAPGSTTRSSSTTARSPSARCAR